MLRWAGYENRSVELSRIQPHNLIVIRLLCLLVDVPSCGL